MARRRRSYDAALRAVERSRPRADMASEWAALGLRAVEPEERVAGLSGGERTKLGLLNCLASRPDLLLLDEPTNHLDLPCIEWLEALLRRFRGPVLVVSHDRALLDAVASQIVSIDARSGEAESFVGDYSAWADDQARREAERWERYRREQRKERRQRQVFSSIESQARQIENTTIHLHYRTRAKKVARKSTVLRDRLQREFDRGERTARPQKKPHGFYGDFQEGERGASRLLSFQRLGLSVGGRRLLAEVSSDVSRGERGVLMGANGSGKTSLLRAAMGELESPCVLEEGRAYLGPSVRVGYLAQEESPGEDGLTGEETAVDLLVWSQATSATEAGNFLRQFLFDHGQVVTPVRRMSYGERSPADASALRVGGCELAIAGRADESLGSTVARGVRGGVVELCGWGVDRDA